MRKISYADAINETLHQMIEKDMVTGGAEFIEEIEWKMSSERAERRILFVCPSFSSFIQNDLDILRRLLTCGLHIIKVRKKCLNS